VTTSNPTACPFDANQISLFVKDAVQRVGGKGAWHFVGHEVRKMAVEAECLRVFSGQVGTTFSAVEMRATLAAMM